MMKQVILIFSFLFICSGIYTQNLIHFQVNMNGPIQASLFVNDADRVVLRGSFNNWTGNDFVLLDNDEDGIYERIFEIEGDPEETIEFKYVILKADEKVLWEKQPNRRNQPTGNRVFQLTEKPQQLRVSVFDFDRYYLALIGEDVIFTVEEMRQDFKVLRETLEVEHCCLYDYTSKTEFDNLFDQQYKLIDHPMQPNEFYKILTPITAKIGCGHTAVWMSGGYWEIDPQNLFPLQIRLVGNYVVVSGTYTDEVLVPAGSIILDINGRPVSEIIEEMQTNYAADAFNIYFINAQIERRFPLIYARRFGFPDEYVVTYALPGRKTSETKTLIPASNHDVREVVFSNFRHPPLEFDVKEGRNLAVLTIPTFIYYDKVPYFKNFIDSCFTVIKDLNMENLILDLRGNDGGDPFCAAPLFSYLQPEPLPYFSQPYGKYADLADSLSLPENHFTGNLITLMDGRCFSTNAHFCSLIKYHKIGTIVGTPSGGTFTCNAGKNTQKRLENTSIQLWFGRSSYATAVEGMDKSKPIEPDYYIGESYRDFLTGKDKYMEKAHQLIEGDNKIGLY